LQDLPKVKTALPLDERARKQYDDSIYQWFKDISSINAELMFAGLCYMSGYKISFEKSDESHDYDFLTNRVPVQVKANITYRGSTDRANKYLEGTQKVAHMSHRGILTIEYVKNEIINFIRYDYLDQIRKAIEQKARIVIIDGTQSSVGFAFNKLVSDTGANFNIKKSLSDALVLYETNDDFIPLVFAANAYDYNYRISSTCLKIPIVKTDNGFTIDDARPNSIDVIN